MSGSPSRSSRAKAARQIERALLGEVSAEERHALHTALRGDDALRAEYDRAALALRIFEGDHGVADYELDLVEGWLVEDFTPAAVTGVEVVRRWLSVRTWFSVFAAAAAAVLVVLMVRMPASLPGHDYGGIKGGGPATALAIDVLCGPDRDVETRGSEALAAAQAAGCAHDDTLSFSYFLDDPRGGVLSLFGIDADGDAMYYVPTPDDHEAISVKPGAWRAVGVGVNLDVNHVAGRTRVFGLVSDTAPSVQDIDAMVRSLAPLAPARNGDADWLRRVDPGVARALCPTPRSCHAAELSFVIRGEEHGRAVPANEESP